MGKYSFREFEKGCLELMCDNMERWTAASKKLSTKLETDQKYRSQTYEFAFTFLREQGKNNIGVDEAIAIWKLFYPETEKYPWIEEWYTFLLKK